MPNLKKKKFVIETEIEQDGQTIVLIDKIEHKPGEDKIKVNGKDETGVEATPPNEFLGGKYIVTNPCVWYRDSRGNWRQYCW